MRVFRAAAAAAVLLWAASAAAVAGIALAFRAERSRRRGPIPAAQAGTLLSPLRRFIHPADRMLAFFALRPGQTVLEVGPGPGYFTPEASRRVGPGGRVLCLDIQRPMLEQLRRRLAEAGASNAHLLQADAARLPLRDGSVDAAFLVAVLGEVPDRVAALRELYRVLRSGGMAAFAETLTDPDYIFRDGLEDACRAIGFELEETAGLPLGYMARFRKPA